MQQVSASNGARAANASSCEYAYAWQVLLLLFWHVELARVTAGTAVLANRIVVVCEGRLPRLLATGLDQGCRDTRQSTCARCCRCNMLLDQTRGHKSAEPGSAGSHVAQSRRRLNLALFSAGIRASHCMYLSQFSVLRMQPVR